jgi:hypothetical protein
VYEDGDLGNIPLLVERRGGGLDGERGSYSISVVNTD